MNQAAQLPGASSFVSHISENEDGELEYDIDSDGFVSSIDEADFLNSELSTEQYQLFGFSSKDEVDSLSRDIKKNLQMGMKLYFLLKPVYDLSPDLDASCCGILFCKAMELYLRNNFANGLKRRFPDYNIKNSANQMIPLQRAQNNDFMIGTIRFILNKKADELGNYMALIGESNYTTSWWNSFNSKLKLFAAKRNKCCHSQCFKWNDMRQLLGYEFKEDGPSEYRTPKIGGIFYESKNGKKLD